MATTVARQVVGIDLGGTKVLGAVLDQGKLLDRQIHHVRGLKREDLLDGIGLLVRDLRESHPEVEAVGMGIPSLIDQQRATAVSSVNLPLFDLPIRDYFEDSLGLPVVVENDANCAALAEARLGAGKDARVTVCLTIGTGVGSGVVIDGQLIRGSCGFATEIGHMVIDKDGPKCSSGCPNNGCLESMASGNALERMSGGLKGETVLELVRAGDQAMSAVFNELATNLGVGIASVLNIFNPDVVAIGGGLSVAGDLLLGPAEQEARRRALAADQQVASIVIAKLGQDAGVVGAGLIAQDALD